MNGSAGTVENANSFRAMVVRRTAGGSFVRNVTERTLDELPQGDVLIRVRYSSLNYKDALSASGNRGVTRRYPHTPGIDAAGVVELSRSPSFSRGDEVLATGRDLGVNTPGGFGQYIRVPAQWVLPLPGTLTLREAMMYGTAGFTAGLCVDAIRAHGTAPGDGSVVVTGATGGVGSMACALLAQLGYRVAAVTGKQEQRDFLLSLGAAEVLRREELGGGSDKALLPSRWEAAVDTVGGPLLSAVIRSVRPYGCVAACGNAASAELSLTVYPFILRGVTLAGIASADCPMPLRVRIWERLAGEWKPGRLETMAREVPLDALDEEIDRILAGRQVGRVLVRLD
jgi:acrylyl-CoA reductase (NADPH)